MVTLQLTTQPVKTI